MQTSISNLILLTLCLICKSFVFANDFDESDIKNQLIQHIDSQEVALQELRLELSEVTNQLYEYFNYRLIWDQNRKNQYLNFLKRIDEDGLIPDDYFLSYMESKELFGDKALNINQLLKFDLLFTESLFRLVHDLYYGRIHPEEYDPNWQLIIENKNDDLLLLARRALDSDSLSKYLSSLLPGQEFYQRLKLALKKYRAIKAAGGWPKIISKKLIKKGDSDISVIQIRKRLYMEGYIKTISNIESPVFDSELESNIRLFQARHNLTVDGIVGKETRQALNVSVDTRITQIIINMERSRWVFRELLDNYLVINIASHKAYLVRDNEIVWESRVIVGRDYRQTPIFKAYLKYIEINPTWTVPPTILKKDVLPKIAIDPGYIQKRDFEILDKNGGKVKFDDIDFQTIDFDNFPYQLRQPPGPENPLGNIKFIFPNPFFVYLHDTPDKELFNLANRTLSSGCIRIENPIDLAALVLKNQAGWDKNSIETLIKTKVTRRINLKQPLSVLLLYWTVDVDDEGRVHFNRDIYGRDKKIIDAIYRQ